MASLMWQGSQQLVMSPAVRLVLFETGREVSACLSDVHCATLARNSVHSWSVVRVLPILVCGEHAVEFQGGCVKHPDPLSVEDGF